MKPPPPPHLEHLPSSHLEAEGLQVRVQVHGEVVALLQLEVVEVEVTGTTMS
jgi:hypothetical protein